MFGVRGLDALGLSHTLFGVAALFLGLVVMFRRKGTRTHRRIGQAYLLAMLALNVTGLTIYDLYGRFGPFHVAAVISLATIVAGFLPVYLRRPHGTWVSVHANFMGWSYVGLLAAFISEIAVRVPGVRFGPGVMVTTVLVTVGGAILIHTRVPKIVSALIEKQVIVH